MTTGTDDRKEMTSTTQVPLSVEGLADWLRSYANYCDPVGGIRQVDVIRSWASAVESLAVERIAPEGQAPEEWLEEARELIDAHGFLRWEEDEFAGSDYREKSRAAGERGHKQKSELIAHLRKRIAAPQAAQSEMTDAEISRLISANLSDFHEKGLFEYTRAVIRTYLKGEAP